MRRFRQLLPEEESMRILREGSSGILSLIDIDGAPYGVPVSYACDDDSHIYLHSATQGQKIDCIKADSRCSFCVIEKDQVVPDEFTTYFRSVIVKGEIRIITDPDEIMKGLLTLCDKYSPGIDPSREIKSQIAHVAVMRIDIASITGKEAIELVRKRTKSL